MNYSKDNSKKKTPKTNSILHAVQLKLYVLCIFLCCCTRCRATKHRIARFFLTMRAVLLAIFPIIWISAWFRTVYSIVTNLTIYQLTILMSLINNWYCCYVFVYTFSMLKKKSRLRHKNCVKIGNGNISSKRIGR